ncbi:MAG: GNAT family N-acetyltransferase [Phycisphaerae bacterium]
MEKLSFQPLTPARWSDFERLFGERGACGGCWCMYWRQTAREFAAGKGAANRAAMKRLVDADDPPGLLAYRGDEPIGWCALAPRERFVRLTTSRVAKPVDDQPVWSVPCFFIARAHRRTGLTAKLLAAARKYARERGAIILEGYPVDPRKSDVPDVFAYTGLASSFERAGFQVAARRAPGRPVMRCTLRGKQPADMAREATRPRNVRKSAAARPRATARSKSRAGARGSVRGSDRGKPR